MVGNILFDTYPAPAIAVDAESGNLLAANPAAQKVFGLSSATPEGTHIDDLLKLDPDGNLLRVNVATEPLQADEEVRFDEFDMDWAGVPARILTARNFHVSGVDDVDSTPRSELLDGLLDDVLSIADIGVWQYDAATDHLVWSREMFRIHGIRAEDFHNHYEDFVALVHPEDRAPLLAARQRSIESGSLFDFVHRIVRPDGEIRHVRQIAKQRTLDGVEIRRGLTQDVTEIARTQEALCKSEERFRLAALAANDVIFSYDFDTDEHWWSEALQAHYGHDPEKMPPSLNRWLDLIHPDDRQAALASHKAARDRGDTNWRHEYRFRRADGRYANVLDRAYFLRDASGRATKSIGSMSDISEIRQNEVRLQALAEVAADAVYDYDLDASEVVYSGGMATTFGHHWIGRNAVPTPWQSCLHPDDAVTVAQDFEGFIKGKARSWQTRYRLRRADGRYAFVQERAVAIRDPDGRARRVIGSIIDITEQREIEERLKQSQKLEAVGQLTGGVAHDFNNLLTVIMGNAELLAESPELNGKLGDVAKVILTTAERGAELISNLLSFSRQQPLRPTSIAIGDLLEEVERLLVRTLPAHIRYRTTCAHDLPPIFADRIQLVTALINLALNAMDAMPNGGELVVGCSIVGPDELPAAFRTELHGAEPHNFMRIAVSDTGTGMDRITVERAFDPFFTTKQPGKGVGMGLSMVYGFVQQSRGAADIRSEPGKGTTVSLYLPASASPELDTAKPVPGPEDELARGQGERVLLVEDDARLRVYVTGLIAELGYRVAVAADAKQALAILESQPRFDLLFTDIVMPGQMDGRALAQKVKERSPGIKVLYTSGYSKHSIIHDGRLDQDVFLLPKPYRKADLARKLREVLSETAA